MEIGDAETEAKIAVMFWNGLDSLTNNVEDYVAIENLNSGDSKNWKAFGLPSN